MLENPRRLTTTKIEITWYLEPGIETVFGGKDRVFKPAPLPSLLQWQRQEKKKY